MDLCWISLCVITDDQIKWAIFVEQTIDNITKGGKLNNFLRLYGHFNYRVISIS